MRKFTTVLMVFLLSAFQLFAQNKTISGKVTDEKGAGIQGASVTAKGSTKGAVTSADGSFTLSVAQTVKQIIVTHGSFESQTITIPSNGVVNVKMDQRNDEMTGVTVSTGIMDYKKKNYAGAVNKVTEKEIANQPVGSMDQILQGRVPGLLALSSSGQPGTSANIIIRGTGSILGGTSPLYIVDGIQVEEGVFQGINPNDFASMDVLRDAAGTALYGSRGSAGVIVVTTKRGQIGKTKISYSAQFGQKDRPAFTYDMMNSKQTLKMQEDIGAGLKLATDPFAMNNLPGWFYSANNPDNAGLSPDELATNKQILDSLGNLNTNWRDVFLRSGAFSNHQLSIQGGNDKARYFSSLGFYNEEGITLRTDMKRVTWRTNIDYKDDKFALKLNTSLGYVRRNFQQSSTGNNLGNPFLVSALNVPYVKAYDDNGKIITGNRATSQKFNAGNTLDLTNLDLNYNTQIKVTSNFEASYKVMKNVTAALTAGIDFRETQNTNYGSRLAFVRTISATPTTNAGFLTEGSSRNYISTVRPSLSWKNNYKDKHDISLSLVGEYVYNNFKNFSATGYGIDPKLPNTPSAITQGNATNNLFAQVGGSKSEDALLSGLLMANYTYDGKYTFTASYRSDGASKLPVDTRWQDFYSIGFVWEAKSEKFLSKVKFVNSLRLKYSYGSAGNYDNFPTGSYGYLGQWGAGNYAGNPSYSQTVLGNPQLRWEKIFTNNIGIDFELFNSRLFGDINLYDRRTKDLFVQQTLAPSATYFGSLSANKGVLQNKGIEVSLNYQVIKTRNTTVTLYTNFAYNRNRVLDLGGVPNFEQGTELVSVGKPVGTHYEVKWGGVDAATGRPLYYDLAGKLTTVYSADNRVQDFGTWEAPTKGAFGAKLKYKNFDFNVMFTFQEGAYKMNNLEYFLENPVGFAQFGYNQAANMRFWQKPGDVVNTPSLLHPVNFSSKLIHNASFIRLREVSASYNLPQSSIDKLKYIKGARFFILTNNLYLWTNWIGLDPEAGATNINLSEFPNPKSITVGVDINF